MKTVTETKYETSDGRKFTSVERARAHEIETFAKGTLGEDVKLTTVKLIESMAGDPDGWVSMLAAWTQEEVADAAE